MNNPESTNRATPELPPVVRKPLAWVPMPVKALVITRALNTIFAAPLKSGELEFLTRRVMNVCVTDADFRFSVRIDQGELRAGNEAAEADVTIAGSIYTFLLLATRTEDADTLFFRRQLKTSGDTELGLYIKNFLDGLDPESLPFHRTLGHLMRGGLAVARRVERIRSFSDVI